MLFLFQFLRLYLPLFLSILLIFVCVYLLQFYTFSFLLFVFFHSLYVFPCIFLLIIQSIVCSFISFCVCLIVFICVFDPLLSFHQQSNLLLKPQRGQARLENKFQCKNELPKMGENVPLFFHLFHKLPKIVAFCCL